ncbi:carboxymuconolactone decarboxylase family protein [Mucilaginibacter sp. SP1R1]|uniref:carboxymuconolactone decarboxylase family protein n=1 Tax=Mucilaginibacter sp. SP1R1 TaxID=2723091 RepID=UPI0016070392|nr:carboxymuconolactone decarboxylase family protein [Mucilaginibacter sp. SP1R1]MBB6147970.1 putative peroxidase-related enzyme [Mucilaginibacter sp. SP1R1]
MKTITVPVREQVSEESQVIFDQMQKRMGRVPNLYATIGYSGNALRSFVDFETTLSKGVFRPKEREAVALIVSEVNSCAYCLAGHTLAAIKNGYTKEDTLAIRKGEVNDPKLSAILLLAKSITENQGHADEGALDNFFAAGYDEAALMELVGLVTLRIFTNYVYALTAIPVDFPAAEPIN